MNSFDKLLDEAKRSRVVRLISYLPKTIFGKVEILRYSKSIDSKIMRTFKNKYKGDTCFIIGNGPSLTIEDLEKLSGFKTFGANLLYRLFDRTDFRPTYYVAADKFFFPDYYNELMDFDGVEHYFFDMKARNVCSLPSNASCFVVDGPFTITKGSLMNNSFSDDSSKFLSLSYTVTYYSLQLAAYMGFKEIVLVGVDHKYTNAYDRKGRLKVNSGSDSYAKGMNPEGRPGANYIDSTTYSYIIAKEYADAHGIRIINATRGGDLDVFERANFDDIVSGYNHAR